MFRNFRDYPPTVIDYIGLVVAIVCLAIYYAS